MRVRRIAVARPNGGGRRPAARGPPSPPPAVDLYDHRYLRPAVPAPGVNATDSKKPPLRRCVTRRPSSVGVAPEDLGRAVADRIQSGRVVRDVRLSDSTHIPLHPGEVLLIAQAEVSWLVKVMTLA